jgi:hypothetical protein
MKRNETKRNENTPFAMYRMYSVVVRRSLLFRFPACKAVHYHQREPHQSAPSAPIVLKAELTSVKWRKK